MTLHEPESVREQYRDSSRFGARVDLHARFSTNPHPWPAWVFDRLDLPTDARILEVGCGPAFLWRENRDRIPGTWRIVATDMSLGMATEGRTEIDISFAVADAQALPFVPEHFDAVVANHMLYHVPDLEAALSEFARVLRPDGKLFAATNGQAHFKEVRDLLNTHWRYVDMFGLESGPDKISGYFKDVSVERYDDALEVPEAEPVVTYVASMSNFWNPSAELEKTLRRAVTESIERYGTFHITKDAGLITARKR